MARRGKKILGIHDAKGFSDEAHLAWVLELIDTYGRGEHVPVVALDQEGKIGADILGVFRAHVRQHRGSFELVPIRASDKPQFASDARIYDRVRDVMGPKLLKALADGLAIPPDDRLREELELFYLLEQNTGRSKLMPGKPEIRKLIGRSCDRADALMLSVFTHWDSGEVKPRPPRPAPAPSGQGGSRRGYDPYARSAYNRR